jgi:hypothetical protein
MFQGTAKIGAVNYPNVGDLDLINWDINSSTLLVKRADGRNFNAPVLILFRYLKIALVKSTALPNLVRFPRVRQNLG